MVEHAEVPPEIVSRVGAICREFPEVLEEPAWVGTRWRIRGRTFAQVVRIDGGWPPVYARAAGVDGPITVLTFRSSGTELDVLRQAGPPFFAPPWRGDEVGVMMRRDEDGEDIDWTEVAELLTESYCVQAPNRLAQLIERPTC